MSRDRDKVYTLSDNDVIGLLVIAGDNRLYCDETQVADLLDGSTPTVECQKRVLRAAKIIGVKVRKRKDSK